MSASVQEKQRVAFQFLANRARTAHREGDGVLVNHLCATALSQLSDYSKNKTLLVPIREIVWMLIFPPFWLIDEYLLDAIQHEILRLNPATQAEEEMCELLRRYLLLVERPFQNDRPKPVVVEAKLEWLTPENRIEDEILLTHLIELTWIRGTNGPDWGELADRWSGIGPSWLKESVSNLIDRLSYQTSLVDFQEHVSARSATSRHAGWLPRLWDATLDCDWKSIDAILSERVPKTGIDSPLSRFLFDYRHFNRINGVWGDDQATGLTRRRVAVASFPKLAFDDLRASRCADAHASGSRKTQENGLNALMHAHRLAMLCEIEALRMWDFFEWTRAIKMQSRPLFTLANQKSENVDLGFHAVRLAIQSLSYDKNVTTIRDTVCSLDFGAPDRRREFFNKLFQAHDIYAYPLLEVFQDFGDSIPPECWDGLVEWSLKYVRLAAEKKLRGAKAIPLSFWRLIFPFVPENHTLWLRLLPELLSEAAVPIKWQSDDGLIRTYLCYAPETVAQNVIRTLIAIDEGGAGDKRMRWETIAEALHRRPELRREFFAWAVAAAPGASQRHHFRTLCQTESSTADENEARDQIRSRIEALIEESKAGNPKLEPWIDYRIRTPIVVTWQVQDLSFYVRLLDLIESNVLLNSRVPIFVMFVQQMAAKGPPVFISELANRLSRWTVTPPGAVSANFEKHPWARKNDEIATEVAEQIAAAVTTVALNASKTNDTITEESLQQLMKRLPAGAPQIARLLLCLAHRAEPSEQMAKLGALRVVVASAWSNPAVDQRDERMADVIATINWFIRNGYENLGAKVDIEKRFVSQAVYGMESLWIAFSKSPCANLRACVAMLLRTLETRQLTTPDQQALLNVLREDARGRVRKAASVVESVSDS